MNQYKWKEASVMSRAGKATGPNRNWYNIKHTDGTKISLDLDRVNEWKRTTEEVDIVVIPKEKQDSQDCIAAKQTELKKLEDFHTYEEVADEGQFRISTTWVLWKKGEETRARLVVRGYEDMQNFPRDSPTLCKSSLRVMLSMIANKGWILETTDVKSAKTRKNF